MIGRIISPLRLVLVSSALLYLVTGCSALQIATGVGLKEPEVSLSALSVKEVSLSSMRIVARLNVSNPNGFGIEVASYDYALEVGEWPVVRGKVTDGFSLPASGGTTVEVPLEVGFGSALGAGMDLLTGSGLAYVLSMNVDVASPLGVIQIPVTREGRISR